MHASQPTMLNTVFSLCSYVSVVLKCLCLCRSIRHLQEASSTDGKGENPHQFQSQEFMCPTDSNAFN